MVQAIDNLTTIIGTVLSLSDHPTLPGYEIAMLRLEEARPVEGKADLITGRLADPVPVAIPRELLGDAAARLAPALPGQTDTGRHDV